MIFPTLRSVTPSLQLVSQRLMTLTLKFLSKYRSNLINKKTILCWTIIVDLAPKTSMCFHLILRQKTLRLMIAGTSYFLASMIRLIRRREPLIVGARTIHIITNLKRMTRWRQPLTQARPLLIIIRLNKFMNNNTEELTTVNTSSW